MVTKRYHASSTGHIMVTTRYSDQNRDPNRDKKLCDFTSDGTDQLITKRFIKPPLLHIESSLDRLGLSSPTHDQRSQQQIGQLRSNQFFSITIIYGSYLPAALVVFVVHTISYIICDSMSKRYSRKGIVSSTYMSSIGARLEEKSERS